MPPDTRGTAPGLALAAGAVADGLGLTMCLPDADPGDFSVQTDVAPAEKAMIVNVEGRMAFSEQLFARHDVEPQQRWLMT